MNRTSISLLVAATLCGSFIQYQPIGVCVFAFHGVYLLFIHQVRSWRWQWAGSLCVACGLTVSMSQLFRFDGTAWNWLSVGVVAALQLGAVHLFWLLAVIHLFLVNQFRHNSFLFCYPTLVASAYSFMAHYSPIGSEASLAYGLAEWQAFVQVVSLFGITGLNFAIVAIATGVANYWIDLPDVAVACLEENKQIEPFTLGRRNFGIKFSLVLFLSISFFGSFRLLSPYMYQRGVEETSIPPGEWVAAACVVWAKDEDPFATTEQILSDSSNGVDPIRLVLWSETAADYYYDDRAGQALASWQTPRYSDLAGAVANMANKYNATIGATYMLWYDANNVDDDRIYNMFSFWDAGGQKLFDYTKRHPVPIVEAATVAGSGTRMGSTATSKTIGPFEAAICFDFDYPEFVRKSVASGLIIQTANTWGMVGYFHGINSSFRAIENGAYLARCGSQGPSGLWDQYGNMLSYQPRYGADVLYFKVPYNPKRLWTFYSCAGFVFDYILYAVTGIYLALAIAALRTKFKYISNPS